MSYTAVSTCQVRRHHKRHKVCGFENLVSRNWRKDQGIGLGWKKRIKTSSSDVSEIRRMERMGCLSRFVAPERSSNLCIDTFDVSHTVGYTIRTNHVSDDFWKMRCHGCGVWRTCYLSWEFRCISLSSKHQRHSKDVLLLLHRFRAKLLVMLHKNGDNPCL